MSVYVCQYVIDDYHHGSRRWRWRWRWEERRETRRCLLSLWTTKVKERAKETLIKYYGRLWDERQLLIWIYNLENTSRFCYNLRIYATDVVCVSTWGRDSLFWDLAYIAEVNSKEGYFWKLSSFLNVCFCRQIIILFFCNNVKIYYPFQIWDRTTKETRNRRCKNWN